MQHQPLLAAVDLGSNSFRYQIARVEHDQLYMLDGARESVRLAAGLTHEHYLDTAAQQRALAALAKFAERLRDFPASEVRVVGTNSLRVAKNARDFIPQAEHILGFPIDVITGHEEARLIYLGVAQLLPPTTENRLVVDIGGGSTEFIIGNGLQPLELESLHMGCVSFSSRYFPDSMVDKHRMKQAEAAARSELQRMTTRYRGQWSLAYGSSGTAKMLNDVLVLNGFSPTGITREGMEKLRAHLLAVGDMSKLRLQGLKPDRIPVLAGGFSIMYAAFSELKIERMQAALGALREGVLYDLLGRAHNNDMRDMSVKQFMQRYRLDMPQAKRVTQLSHTFAQQLLPQELDEPASKLLHWTAQLHEIGISVAHHNYQKHSAYILANAEMPGFAKKEQQNMSQLAYAQRGSLEKLPLGSRQERALTLALRLAILFYRNRRERELPKMALCAVNDGYALTLPGTWLEKNLATTAALQEEILFWKAIRIPLQLNVTAD